MEIMHLPALANLFNVASYNHSWVLLILVAMM